MTVAARLLGERYGLRIDGSTVGRLERLLALARERTGTDAAGYDARLAADPRELAWLMERLTVQESEWFRHPAQLEHVAERVARGGGGVLWSAGCADGQEAWSLAMLLEEAGAPGWSVLATDLSEEALERAVAGRYPERRLRGLSDARRARFVRPDGDAFVVSPALRSRVRFARHNVATDPLPPDAGGRVVLCRNVLIYLLPEAIDAFLSRLRDRMPADGVLLLGAAEALPADDPHFAARRIHGGYVYGPRAATAAPPRPASAPPPPRPRPQRPRTAPPPVAELPRVAELLAAGEAHAAAGRPADAAVAFRKATYLSPDDPIAHASLAFALEAAGDAPAARRAFRAAAAALDRAPGVTFEGWAPEELRRVVAERGGVA